MQQVAQPTVLPAIREAAAPTVVAKKKVDPQLVAVPLVIIAGLIVVISWVATFLFLVGCSQYLASAWKFNGL